MATDGIMTCLQEEMGLLQHELSQLDSKMEVKLDAKLDARFKDFREDFKGEICSEVRYELHSFFDQYFRQPTIGIQGLNGKRLLGTPPPRFPPKDTVVMSTAIDGGHLGTSSRIGAIIQWEDSFSYNVHGLMVQTFVVGELS